MRRFSPGYANLARQVHYAATHIETAAAREREQRRNAAKQRLKDEIAKRQASEDYARREGK